MEVIFLKNIFNNIFNGFLDSIFPKHIKCIFCGEELPELNSYDTCDKCKKTLPLLKEKTCCIRCGAELEDDQLGVCFNCKKNNFDFLYARSVCSYTGAVIPTMYKFKFGKGKYLAEPLAYYMYEVLKELNWGIDIITYVPMFPKREKIRGYNQARELAIELSKVTNIPMEDVFEKIIDTHEQAKLNSQARRKNLKDAFKVINKNLKDKTILIIDDIFTTGTTTAELSRILKGKCLNSYVLTFAHTKTNEKDV